mmetsp:Transcript_13120/g.31300  ORF Transcript_13120/g.31300 Transcript_13120/m.31300 type:complete len:213 (-) Transcript_13120:1078-1716(-)
MMEVVLTTNLTQTSSQTSILPLHLVSLKSMLNQRPCGMRPAIFRLTACHGLKKSKPAYPRMLSVLALVLPSKVCQRQLVRKQGPRSLQGRKTRKTNRPVERKKSRFCLTAVQAPRGICKKSQEWRRWSDLGLKSLLWWRRHVTNRKLRSGTPSLVQKPTVETAVCSTSTIWTRPRQTLQQNSRRFACRSHRTKSLRRKRACRLRRPPSWTKG